MKRLNVQKLATTFDLTKLPDFQELGVLFRNITTWRLNFPEINHFTIET